jgi:conjugal transfer pilus assembly protein TraB
MEAIKEAWTNPQFRSYIIILIIVALAVFIGLSMVEDTPEAPPESFARQEQEESSIFGSISTINQVAESEASEMVDQMAQEHERRTASMRRQQVEEQRKNAELIKGYQSLEKRLYEQEKQLQALAKGEGTVAPRRTPLQNNGSQVANQTPAQVNVPVYGTAINPNQRQVITPGPLPGSPIIRTVTQRSIRTLRDGEVTRQSVQLSDIGNADRVNPLRPEYREPLSKVEEEGREVFTLSMGSIISGTLLNGVAAPTASDRKDNPMPVLMRIKREAIMPNDVTLDIIDCHMLGSAIGDLSQSRVLIRAEAISCNTHTGESIEKRINAYAVDSSDGLAGIQGDVVFKSGAMLANSMKAEFLSGFASAFSPNRVQALNTSPDATELWQTQNINRAAGAGIGQGLSGAADRIASYYMDLAEGAHPVIELIPGIEVDFIVQAGMTLNLGGREKPYTNNRMDNKGGFFSASTSQEAPTKPAIPNVSISLQ